MTDIQIFKNEQFGEVRTMDKNGEPWFVANDICKVLGHTNSRVAVAALDEDEKGVSKVYTLGGEQQRGHAAAQGKYGHAAAQGYKGHASVGGKDAIAAAFGIEGNARACLGSWIMLAEWVLMGDGWHIKTVKTAKIDGEKLKADTWYILENGEFEEAEK